jgi:hypothetical protein
MRARRCLPSPAGRLLRRRHLLRTAGQSLAARHQREHERPPPPVLPQGQRPARFHRRRSAGRRAAPQRPTAQATGLAQPRAGHGGRTGRVNPSALRRPRESAVEPTPCQGVGFQAASTPPTPDGEQATKPVRRHPGDSGSRPVSGKERMGRCRREHRCRGEPPASVESLSASSGRWCSGDRPPLVSRSSPGRSSTVATPRRHRRATSSRRDRGGSRVPGRGLCR